MFSDISEKAYAKVNFGLKVFPKRQDGFHDSEFHNEFHNIESIFQTVDLYDNITVSWNEERNCIVSCDSMELPQKNTITASYQAFCEVVETSFPGIDVPGVKVFIQKGIPSGGGLGGGSSDAAAFIRVLEKICGISLSGDQRDYISGKTGSDVFFFMNCDSEGKGCALVSGRGEIVKKINPRKDLFLLLVFPKFGSSTKEAYCLVDEYLARKNKVEGPDFLQLEAIYNSPVENWSFENTFTPALSERYGELQKAIDDLKKSGCKYAQMSGSGSTVFGVFTLEQQAIHSSNLLADTWNCKIARIL